MCDVYTGQSMVSPPFYTICGVTKDIHTWQCLTQSGMHRGRVAEWQSGNLPGLVLA